MKKTTNDTKRLEALHRLYYTLAHEVLPEIILSDNVDARLQPNPAGEGVISEAGTAAIPDVSQQNNPETAAGMAHAPTDDELLGHSNGPEDELLGMDLLDFEDELQSLGDPLAPAAAADYTFDDAPLNDFDEPDDADAFDPDAAYNDFDAADEDFLEADEDEELPVEKVDDLISELESMLELHTLGQAYDNPDEAFLANTWREAWFQTELEDYPANTGYTLRRINEQGYEMIHFTFPTPVGITDAWQALAIRKAGAPYRYFTLENTMTDDSPKAVLAEWKAGDKHTSYSTTTHDVTDPQVFLNLVFEQLA